jgi:vacuolar-type H+-ATPase subunit H
MNKHLKGLENPTIKEKVLSNILSRAEREKRVREKHLGFPATIIDEMAFNLPSKNMKFKELISKYSSDNKNTAKVAKALGFLGGGLLPGGLAVKGFSKVGKLGRVLKGGGLKQAMSQGALYGATGDTIRNMVKGEEDLALKTLSSGLGGVSIGALTGIASPAVKGALGLLKGKSGRLAAAKEAVETSRRNLASKLTNRDFAHIKNITAKGTDSLAGGKLDTLLHNPTENSKAVADALYQLSPKARQIINTQKDQLGKNMESIMEEAFKKASGVGKTPNADKFVELIQKRGREQARPIYEEVYKSPIIELSERLEGSPQITKVIKKAMANRNKMDINKPDFQRTSPRILDEAKKNLDDLIQAQKAAGHNHEASILKEQRNELIDLIEKKAPKYKEARAVAEKYLKTGEAGEKGKKFLDT